jgi:predicted kinase
MRADKYLENAATTAMLIEAGFDMMRQNIRRRHPDASDASVDALLGAWACREDDPLPGDTAGSVRVRQRFS